MKLTEVWEWFSKYYAPNYLRESTQETMRNIVETKILPEIGHIKLGDFHLIELPPSYMMLLYIKIKMVNLLNQHNTIKILTPN